MTAKVTIVIVPGSCHTQQHFATLISQLQQADHPVVCERLPSVDPPPNEHPDMSDDVAFIRQRLLQPLIEKGADILLVCHSYAGLPGGAAALGYSKKERTTEGQPGGIVGIAAYLAYDGAAPLKTWPENLKVM